MLGLLGVHLRVRNVTVKVTLLLGAKILVLGVRIEVHVPTIGRLILVRILAFPRSLTLSVVVLLLARLACWPRIAHALLLLKMVTPCHSPIGSKQ